MRQLILVETYRIKNINKSSRNYTKRHFKRIICKKNAKIKNKILILLGDGHIIMMKKEELL